MIISTSKLKNSAQMLLDVETIILQEFDLKKKLPTAHCASRFKDVHFIFWPDNLNLHRDGAGCVN
jgi:hypothetical protein